MRRVGVGLANGPSERCGQRNEVMATEDCAEGINHVSADGFGGSDLLMGAPADDIETFPHDGVVVRATAF